MTLMKKYFLLKRKGSFISANYATKMKIRIHHFVPKDGCYLLWLLHHFYGRKNYRKSNTTSDHSIIRPDFYDISTRSTNEVVFIILLVAFDFLKSKNLTFR